MDYHHIKPLAQKGTFGAVAEQSTFTLLLALLDRVASIAIVLCDAGSLGSHRHLPVILDLAVSCAIPKFFPLSFCTYSPQWPIAITTLLFHS